MTLPAWLSPPAPEPMTGRVIPLLSSGDNTDEIEASECAKERGARRREVKRIRDSEVKRQRYRTEDAYRQKILEQKAAYRARRRQREQERRLAQRKAYWRDK